MAYDPKRPRPRADADEPAPVEALLDPQEVPVASEAPEDAKVSDADPTATDPTAPEPTAPEPEPTDTAVTEPAASEPTVIEPDEAPGEPDVAEPAAVLGRQVPGASSNGSGTRSAPDVPVAPAPEEGTTNRAVLAAAIGGAVLAVLVWLLWHRRRAGGND
jgi:hypothetical protein